LTFTDGSSAKDKLTGIEGTGYSYEFVEGQLPVKNHKATLSVEEDEDYPDRSEVHWEASFKAQGTSEEDARRRISEILETGVRGIKKVAIDADDAKQGVAHPPPD
jgi:hypothetical protein